MDCLVQQLETLAYQPDMETPINFKRSLGCTPHFQVDALIAVILERINERLYIIPNQNLVKLN